MAINDTTVPGLPAGRSGARRRRTLTRPAGTSAPASPCAATAAPAPHQALLALLEAHNAVAAEVSLPRALQRVVEGARDITGARYAALTLCTPDGSPGTRVESGRAEQAQGEVPRTPSEPSCSAAPERSLRSAEQRPFLGWPPERSRYRSLRVPVTARGSVLGHLQVSGPPAGRGFSADDEDLVTALAMTAGIAVLNLQCSDGPQSRQDTHHGLPPGVVRGLPALGLALLRVWNRDRARSTTHALRGPG